MHRRPGPFAAAHAFMGGVTLLLASAAPLAAQPARPDAIRIGKPLVQNYQHRDFRAEVQNWDVVQGDSGILYFANNAGVLEYDGRTWRLIELPSHLDVRYVVKDTRPTGRIFVGAVGDFGYLGPDAVGQLQYHTLLPPEARQDNRFDQLFIPAIAADAEASPAVYFSARHTLCRWANDTLQCQETEPSLSRVFTIGGRNYVQKKAGLMEMLPGGAPPQIEKLRPVPGGDSFRDIEITTLLPYSSGRDERLLAGTRDFRLFVQRGATFEPFAAGARDPRIQDELIRGAVLPDDTFVLATQRRGVLIVDRDGRVIRQIDQSAGLQENHVLAVWPDRDGALWLGLQNGVSRVDVSSPFSIFDERVGLEREWRSALKHQGTLYVRGYKGLYAAPIPGAARAHGAPATSWAFTRIKEVEPPVWSIAVAADSLLASSKDSVFALRDGKPPQHVITYPSMPMSMYRSRSDPARVYVGLSVGVASLHFIDGAWRDEGRLPGIDDTITSMAEGRNGALWMVSQRQRILRVEFEPSPKSPRIKLYSLGRGMLTGRVLVREVDGRPVFLTETGIFELDAAGEGFVPSPTFAVLTEAGRSSFSNLAEDARGDIWVASRKPGAVDILRRQLDGRYVADTASLLQMPAWSVYPEPEGGVVWLSVPDYLLRYDLSIQTRAANFTTLIRKVTVNDDTVVFGGTPTPAMRAANAPILDVPYGSNSLHFEFAAPRFEHAERSEFQSYLDGFDKHWSGWTKDPTRSYTNLPFGDYRFHVRARDARGVVGHEAVFGFAVLRPWYRTWLAYASYALLICGVLAAVLKIQLRRAQLKMLREVEHLELEKLRELDRMKSRFFTDISHEFRTPLTLILGPVGQMLQEIKGRDVRQRLLLVRRNAEYLLRLISQLLDLSKVESGTMRLHAAEGDVGPVLKTIVMPFIAVAEQQGIDLRFEVEANAISSENKTVATAPFYFDREVIEKIVNNLLTNACKFTPQGGTVRVRLRHEASGFVEIVVSDTGIGVRRDQLPQIFNRFYQGDSSRSREGIGVGLALVKELVELHRGTITVDSGEGAGTTFVVRLPKGRDHLLDDEIIARAHAPADAAAAELTERVESAPTAAASIADAQPFDAPEPVDERIDAVDEEAPTVLIVEDHADVRAFIRDHVQPHYRVIEAKDGAEGLDIAMSSLPDLVLSDVMMGPMNGYELCKALKSNEKTCHIPVVLLTARAGREDKLMGLDIGADCYLIKPFDPSELLVQVRNLIDQRRLLRERFSGSVVLKPSEMAVTPMDQAFLTRVLAAVEQHLADPDFDVERLGREVGLSRSQLHRKLRALTNQPPTLLIRSIRLQRAAELFKQDAGSVAEVAYLVGFSSQAYFAKCFREQFGCAPRDYARSSAHASQV